MHPEVVGTRTLAWSRLRQECAAVCLVGMLFAAPLRAQDVQEKVDVNDLPRTYVVHLPKGYDSKQHYPVVVLLPGQNQQPDDMQRLTHFDQLVADKNGIIAVYPNPTHGRWNIAVHQEQPAMAPRRGYGRHGGYGGGGYPGGGG
jgi:poly(3-hydroxybutyrate) depolymerase